jgi:hypothetical protein
MIPGEASPSRAVFLDLEAAAKGLNRLELNSRAVHG